MKFLNLKNCFIKNKYLIISIIIVSVLTRFINSDAISEILYLKDGREINCTSLWFNNNEYACEISGATIYFNKNKVDLAKLEQAADEKARFKKIIDDRIKFLNNELESLKIIKDNFYKIRFTLGEWSVDNQGLKSKVTIKFEAGLYNFTQTYNDGSQNSTFMTESVHESYPFRYAMKLSSSSNPYEEYYVIDDKGFLYCFDYKGLIPAYLGICDNCGHTKKVLENYHKIEKLHWKLRDRFKTIDNRFKQLKVKSETTSLNDVAFAEWEYQVDNLLMLIGEYKKAKNKLEQYIVQ